MADPSCCLCWSCSPQGLRRPPRDPRAANECLGLPVGCWFPPFFIVVEPGSAPGRHGSRLHPPLGVGHRACLGLQSAQGSTLGEASLQTLSRAEPWAESSLRHSVHQEPQVLWVYIHPFSLPHHSAPRNGLWSQAAVQTSEWLASWIAKDSQVWGYKRTFFRVPWSDSHKLRQAPSFPERRGSD